VKDGFEYALVESRNQQKVSC